MASFPLETFLDRVIWAAREHVIRHGDKHHRDSLLSYLMSERYSDAGPLIRILEKYCSVAYMKAEGGRFRLVRSPLGPTESELHSEISEVISRSDGRRTKTRGPAQGISAAKFRTEPLTDKKRKWRDVKLVGLSVEQIKSLQRNAVEAKDSTLAHRCELGLNAQAFAKEAPDANALLRGPHTLEEIAAVISRWPRDRLKKAAEKLHNKVMPERFSRQRKSLLGEMDREVRRTRHGSGGNPFLQGGRGDGNKPDRRRRPGTG
jgi:hypothetical protein